MATTKIERDSFGTIEVAGDRLWGAQTKCSLVTEIEFEIGAARGNASRRREAALSGLNRASTRRRLAFTSSGASRSTSRAQRVCCWVPF
jgi:fumarate hydratase class II